MGFFSGKNTGVGCQFLLQWIFPTKGSNPGIEPGSPALQADPFPSEPPGKYLLLLHSQDTGKEIVTNLSASGTFSRLTSLFNILPILNDWAPKNSRGSSQSFLLTGLKKHFSRLGSISSSPDTRVTHSVIKPSTVKQPLPQSTHACAQSLQSCQTLYNPMDCSPPGSSVHGILQARILEWVAVFSSRGSSQSRNRTQVSYVSCIGR